MTAPLDDEPRAEAPQARPRRLDRLHAVADKVPTSWLAGIGTAAFLAVTAGFGGLAAVATPPIPELGPGDEHVNAQLSLIVERAVLIDEFPEAGVTVRRGQRVLSLVVTAENRWTQALRPENDQGVLQALRIPRLGDEPPDAIARFDDATTAPWLQPGVPAQLVVSWVVDARALTDGDDLRLELRDATFRTGQFVQAGDYWVDPVVAAHVTVGIDDVGAGADAEGET